MKKPAMNPSNASCLFNDGSIKISCPLDVEPNGIKPGFPALTIA